MPSDSGQPLIRYRLSLLFSLILSLTPYSGLITVQNWLIQDQGSQMSDLFRIGWIIFRSTAFARQFLEKRIAGREDIVETILLCIAVNVLLEIFYGLEVANLL